MKSALTFQWYLKRKAMAILWVIVMGLSLIVAQAGETGHKSLGIALFILNAYHVILGLSFFYFQGDKLDFKLARSLPLSHRRKVYQSSLSRITLALISFLVVYLIQWGLVKAFGGNIYSLRPLVLAMVYFIFLDGVGAISMALAKDGRGPIYFTVGLYLLTMPFAKQFMRLGMEIFQLPWFGLLLIGALIFIFTSEVTAKMYENRWEH